MNAELGVSEWKCRYKM